MRGRINVEKQETSQTNVGTSCWPVSIQGASDNWGGTCLWVLFISRCTSRSPRRDNIRLRWFQDVTDTTVFSSVYTDMSLICSSLLEASWKQHDYWRWAPYGVAVECSVCYFLSTTGATAFHRRAATVRRHNELTRRAFAKDFIKKIKCFPTKAVSKHSDWTRLCKGQWHAYACHVRHLTALW